MKYIHLGLIAMLIQVVVLAQAAAEKEETPDPIVIDLAKTSTLSQKPKKRPAKAGLFLP